MSIDKNNRRERSFILKNIFIFLILISAFLSSCSITKNVPNDQYLLTKVDVSCDNPDVKKDELKTIIRQKPNRKILFFFRFHLRTYNLFKSQKGIKWRDKIAEVVGEPPVIFDDFATDKSVQLMKSYLMSQSYYDAEVSVDKVFKKKKAKLTYKIETGKPIMISKYNYDILDPDINRLVLLDTANAELKVNDKLNTDKLQAERERLVKFLKTNGYYYFSLNNIHYYADTIQDKYNSQLTLSIRKSFDKKDQTSTEDDESEIFVPQAIKNIFIYSDHNSKSAQNNAKEYEESLDTIVRDGINIIYSNKLKIKPSVFLQSCFFKPGDWYNIRNVEKTHSHLSGLKQFKYINFKFSPSEDEVLPSRREKFLDSHIYLTPLSKQSYSVDLEGSVTSGNFGMAGSLTYGNKNLFKGAEIFSAKGFMAFQTVKAVAPAGTGNEIVKLPLFNFNTLEYGVEFKFDIPRMVFSFTDNYDFVKRHKLKTQIKLSYSHQMRPDYTRTMNNVSFGYYLKDGRNKYITHYLNLLELNFVKVSGFSDAFAKQIENLYIKHSYENQLFNILSYSMLYNDQSLTKSRSFKYILFNIETSGNVPTLFCKAFGIPKVRDSYRFLDIEFAQFLKTNVDYRYYHVFNEKQRLVYRGYFGIGIPYGNSSKGLPFVKKYFIGGANDLRAWAIRGIGPGSYVSTTTSIEQIADMKIVFNLEYRFKMISIVNGALFLDAGNIWSINKKDNRPGALFKFNDFYKEFALGTGFGVRFDISLFVIRFDFGIPIHNPMLPEGDRWLESFKNFRIRNFTLNFGINYPF